MRLVQGIFREDNGVAIGAEGEMVKDVVAVSGDHVMRGLWLR